MKKTPYGLRVIKKMPYALRVRLITSSVLLVIVAFFGILGYHATHQLFALSPAPSSVYIFTDKVYYRTGQNITVIIANKSDQDINITNNCPQQPLSVYYLNSGQWEHMTATAPSSKCVGEPHTYSVPAHKSIGVDYSPWPSLFSKPGEYQIIANLNGYFSGPATILYITQ